jgi:hypothetical protein
MAGQCKECRFYDGKNCAVAKAARVPNFTCANRVSYMTPNVGAVKQCKTCGFYDGSNCSSSYEKRVANFTCANWAAYR